MLYLGSVRFIVVVLISSGLWLVSPALTHAQTSPTTVEVEEVTTTPVVISSPLELPDPTKETTFYGSGRPGATIMVTILAGDTVLFQQATTVNTSSQWRIIVPPLNQTPTQILIDSQAEVTLLQEIETVTVTTAATASGLVVLQMILERILRVFQVAGLLGYKRTRGFVFDVETKKPVPFARLTIENDTSRKGTLSTPLLETVVSTVDGFFKTVALPAGSYTLTAVHPNFRFPVKTAKPWYASTTDFYQGESVTLNDQKELDIIFIPMQANESTGKTRTYWFNFQVLSTVVQQLVRVLSVPMGILSVLVLIFYPSFINFIIVSLYIVLALQSVMHSLQTRKLAGVIKNAQGQPISDVVIRIYRTVSEADELATVGLTDKSGSFAFRLPPGTYRALITKDGLTLSQDKGLSYESIELQKSVTNLTYTMTEVPAFNWNKQDAPPITLP